jgi:hypothetical protein
VTSSFSGPVQSRVAEVLRLGEGLFTQTLAELRACGRGRRECVVYWSGPRNELGYVDEVLHPDHGADIHGFEIAASWLDATCRNLARRRRAIRVQVHTHPAEAFHSATDDRYPIVHTPGFLSLVLPDFATGPDPLQDAYLARLGEDGAWSCVDLATAIEAIR